MLNKKTRTNQYNYRDRTKKKLRRHYTNTTIELKVINLSKKS